MSPHAVEYRDADAPPRWNCPRYAMSIAFWCVIAFLMGLQYRPSQQALTWASFVELMGLVAAHAFAMALWAPPIFYLVGSFVHYSRHRFLYVLLWALGTLPFLVLYTTISWLVIPPYDMASRTLASWVELLRNGFADQTLIYIAMVVAGHAYEYLKRARKQEAERYEYQQALAASELQALKMQVQPHFLFNTLHGIATLIEEDANRAKAMILKLSNLLRTTLERDNSDLIPLEDELKFVREYLEIEKMRFGSRLEIEWAVGSETLRLLVPQMILQPLVENAVRHGIAPSREGGWIEVAAGINHAMLNIGVRNSAGGQTSNGTGVGLRNVEARLKYLYSGDASLRLIFGEDRTVTATLTLPILNAEPGDALGHNAQAAGEAKDPTCAFSSSMTNP